MNSLSEKVQSPRWRSAFRMLLLAITLVFPAASKTLVSSTANSLNEFGLIVGTRCYDDSTCRATLWFRDLFVFDLGVLPHGSSSAATGINNLGQIVGYSNVTTGPLSSTQTHAVVWALGNIHDLGLLNPGDVSSQATGINDAGQVVGSSCKPAPPLTNPECQAFVYRNGKLHSLDPIPGGSTSWATAINAKGEIAGYGDAPAPSPPFPPDYPHSIHAIVWTKNGLDHFGGTSKPVMAFGLNDSGSVVGVSESFAFIRTNGVLTGVATSSTPGPNHSVAYGVNNKNQVVGVFLPGGPLVPFLWQSGTTTYLPTPLPPNSTALAINEFGLVVGWTQAPGAAQVAVMWEHGAVKPLKQ